MAAIDVLIVLGFVAYAVASGLRARRVASQNLEEYFLAGRSLPGWKAGLSMAATQFAADTPLLVTGLIATAGVFAMWRLWIYAVAFLVLGFVLATSWRRAGVVTDAELTERRYGGRAAAVLRAVKAIYFGTVFNCVVLSFVLLAATRIAEPFLTWDQWGWFPSQLHGVFVDLARWIGTPITVVGDDPASWPPDVWIRSANNLISIAAILLVTTFYSTTGGLRAVVDTDVMQLGLMVAGTAAFAWYVVDQVGGLGSVPDAIRARFPLEEGGIRGDQILAFTPSGARDAGVAVLALLALQWLAQMNSDGTGYLAQRTMACRSDRDARRAAVWFAVTQILVRSLLWIPLGLALLLMFPPEAGLAAEHARSERELTYVRGMAELPPGLKGLLVTAMLAALASTVDTHLNWGSSYWTNDIYRRFVCEGWLRRTPSPRSLVWVARAANLLVLSIALVIMTRLGSIATAWKTSLLLGAGMGGMLLLRWLWWRITAWGELAAVLASAALAPVLLGWWTGGGADDEAQRLLVMFVASTATGVLVSLATRPAALDGLVAFYRAAHPPGAWGVVARAAGADPSRGGRRLALGLLTVAVASLSLFSILTAAGSLIADSPPPTWFPWRGPWLAAVALLGLGLVPLWRHLAGRLDREDARAGA
jgi:Na+/proline symporter